MTTYKRISGDYNIQTLNSGDKITVSTSNVLISGNVSASANIIAGNVLAGAYFFANGVPFSGGGGGNASLPLANGTSNINISTANGNVTIAANGTYTWTFDTTGNIDLPASGSINFNAGGIVQTPDEDFAIRVQDADDDGFSVLQQVDDGSGTVLGQTTLQRDQFQIEFPQPGIQFRFTDSGQTEIPGNIRALEYVDTSLYSVSNNDGDGTVELKVISFAGDVLGSNVRVTQSNATISTNNAEFTWLFDNTGTLNLPGLTGHIATATDQLDIFSDVDEYNGITANTSVTNVLNQANVGIVTSSGGANITWTFDDTGNLQAPGNISATGNVTGNYFIGDGSQLTNLPAGNYSNANVAAYLPTYTGTITANVISATGNVTGNYFIGDGSQLTNLPAGNYSNANVATFLADFGSNSISTTGNVTAGFFTGNGAGLTGVVATGNVGSANMVANGTSMLNIPVANGNIVGNINGVTLVYVFSEFGANIAGYVAATGNVDSANLHTSGVVSATGNVRGGNINTAGLITATGNITGGNVLTSGLITATGNIAGNYFLGNGALLTGLPATYSNANVAAYLPTYSGNVSAGNVLVSGDVSAAGNITGLNINSSNADLAECYQADADYEPGTVVMFGGTAEVTVCNTDACPQVAGVISANPAYKMNSGLDGPHVVTVALLGRVPVQVQGPVSAGAMMVSAGNGRARAEVNPAMGTVLGKAVQGFDGDVGTIEIVVGRL